MSSEVFGKDTIESISRQSRRLKESAAALDMIPHTAYNIQDLYNSSHTALNSLSNIFDFVVFNMRLTNDIFLVLDKLPNAEEMRKTVETIKHDHEFINWEKRLREDEVKEKEKVNE